MSNRNTHTRRISTRWAATTKPRPSFRVNMAGVDIVYYVRRNGLVKIGYTSNIDQRKGQLRAHWTDVAAFEYGGRDLEQLRHQQFAHLRAEGDELGVEHYHEGPDLTEHMRATMAATVALIMSGDMPTP